MHQSFVSYKNFRYAVFAGVLVISGIIAYAWHSPRQPPNGGTWLGYTLGTVAALLIVYLMWFGVRKRSFRSTGNAVGWLSAHVYLGGAVLLLATLHCGFQFGWNLHTVAYVLMCLVIGTGLWGVYTYVRYPNLIIRTRGNVSREQLFENVKDLDRTALRVASELDPQVHDLVAEAIRRTHVGGGIWAQLSARDSSALLLPVGGGRVPVARLVPNKGQQVLIELLAERQAISNDSAEITKLQTLLEIAGNKAELLRKLQRDIQLQGLLQFWLYFHLPLCFGLIAALIAHIIAVFLYW
jgi:hypothetical protein